MKAFAIAAAVLLAAAPAAAQHQGHQAHQEPPVPQNPLPHGHRAPPAQHGDHAHAGADDRRAVLAVTERMFAALAAKDGAALLAEVVPEGRATANDLGPRRGVRSMSWADFAGGLARIPGRPMERSIEPHVHVEGDIAMIWSRYEFTLDGRFSHCGINHFDLIRQDGRWRVLNVTWTQQYENCPGRPRGPQGERG